MFGEIRGGRLERWPYSGAIISLWIAWILLGTQQPAFEGTVDEPFVWTGSMITLVAVSGSLGVALTFASLNVLAKRLRDTGLPAWRLIGIYIAILIVLAFSLAAIAIGADTDRDGQITGLAGFAFIVAFLVLIIAPIIVPAALLFMPTDCFVRDL
ncbi:MAG: hypothetical protein AAFY56_12925 [Pseudomonadota bacterium]